MNKYRNVKTEVDGIKFASKKEARRYSELKLMEKAGEITFLSCHPHWILWVNDQFIGRYTADFDYMDGDKYVVEDVKSAPTRKKADYRLRKKLMKAIHGIEIREV